MARDVVVLASISIHVSEMTSFPKIKPRVKMMTNKKGLSRGLTNTSRHFFKDALSNSRELQRHKD